MRNLEISGRFQNFVKVMQLVSGELGFEFRQLAVYFHRLWLYKSAVKRIKENVISFDRTILCSKIKAFCTLFQPLNSYTNFRFLNSK